LQISEAILSPTFTSLITLEIGLAFRVERARPPEWLQELLFFDISTVFEQGRLQSICNRHLGSNFSQPSDKAIVFCTTFFD
jgi:hypothetical protein